MNIKDIQTRLNTAVQERSEREFKQAVDQCYKLMRPFYEPLQSSYSRVDGDREEQLEQAKKGFELTSDGYIHLFKDMTVPKSYVAKKQNEESEDFIKKVTLLRQDVDSLLETVEDMERR
jgi:hypothetical protein